MHHFDHVFVCYTHTIYGGNDSPAVAPNSPIHGFLQQLNDVAQNVTFDRKTGFCRGDDDLNVSMHPFHALQGSKAMALFRNQSFSALEEVARAWKMIEVEIAMENGGMLIAAEHAEEVSEALVEAGRRQFTIDIETTQWSWLSRLTLASGSVDAMERVRSLQLICSGINDRQYGELVKEFARKPIERDEVDDCVSKCVNTITSDSRDGTVYSSVGNVHSREVRVSFVNTVRIRRAGYLMFSEDQGRAHERHERIDITPEKRSLNEQVLRYMIENGIPFTGRIVRKMYWIEEHGTPVYIVELGIEKTEMYDRVLPIAKRLRVAQMGSSDFDFSSPSEADIQVWKRLVFGQGLLMSIDEARQKLRRILDLDVLDNATGSAYVIEETLKPILNAYASDRSITCMIRAEVTKIEKVIRDEDRAPDTTPECRTVLGMRGSSLVVTRRPISAMVMLTVAIALDVVVFLLLLEDIANSSSEITSSMVSLVGFEVVLIIFALYMAYEVPWDIRNMVRCKRVIRTGDEYAALVTDDEDEYIRSIAYESDGMGRSLAGNFSSLSKLYGDLKGPLSVRGGISVKSSGQCKIWLSSFGDLVLTRGSIRKRLERIDERLHVTDDEGKGSLVAMLNDVVQIW